MKEKISKENSSTKVIPFFLGERKGPPLLRQPAQCSFHTLNNLWVYFPPVAVKLPSLIEKIQKGHWVKFKDTPDWSKNDMEHIMKNLLQARIQELQKVDNGFKVSL